MKKPVFLLSLIILLYCSCKTSNKATTNKSNLDPFTADYYLQFSSNEERIIELLSGKFYCYSVRKKDTWRVNDGKDSLICYGMSIGNPNKQGYWVYREVLMTHLPEAPLLQTFHKISRLSPDSFMVEVYSPRDKEENPYIGAYLKNKKPDLDLSLLSKGTCVHYFIKRGQLDFQSETDGLCNQRKKEEWLYMKMNPTPSQTRIETKIYKTSNPDFSKKDNFNHTILYYRRFKN